MNVLDKIKELPQERQEKILKEVEKLLEQQQNHKKLFQIYNLINLTSSLYIHTCPVADNLREEYYENLASVIFSDNIYNWVCNQYPEMKNYYRFSGSAKEDDVKLFSNALERYIHDNIDPDYEVPTKEQIDDLFSLIK